jgi:hypothetical protein
MHLQNVDFQRAVLFLGGIPELPRRIATGTPAVVQREKSLVPFPVQENWTIVWDYLTQVRKISRELVDSLHLSGAIYGDKFRNDVFLS